MGGAPKAPKPQPVPPPPKPVDYKKMADASIRVAKESLAAEEKAIKRLYPKYIGMQFDTADKLAGELDNQYLGRVRGVVDEELAAASTPNTIEAELQRQAEADLRKGPSLIESIQLQTATDRLASGPTAIERELESSAERELALGRALTPEQERAATQQARAGMAARGLGTGTGALAAEVLNRDAFASQREAERRNFADQTNKMLLGNALTREDSARAAESYTLGNQADRRAFANQANQIDLARRQRRTGLAGLYGDLDPYRAAIGPAFGLGSSTLGQTSGQVRDIYGGSLQTAGGVATFNTNMAASNRNAILNNNAALQGGYMQAGAAHGAGMMGMVGSGVGAAVGIAGIGIAI